MAIAQCITAPDVKQPANKIRMAPIPYPLGMATRFSSRRECLRRQKSLVQIERNYAAVTMNRKADATNRGQITLDGFAGKANANFRRSVKKPVVFWGVILQAHSESALTFYMCRLVTCGDQSGRTSAADMTASGAGQCARSEAGTGCHPA